MTRRLTTLSDFHLFKKGIEVDKLSNVFFRNELKPEIITYALMRNYLSTIIARKLKGRDMVKIIAWKE